jgi:hypothetical protein
MSVDELKQQVAELKQQIHEMDGKLNELHKWIDQDGTKITNHIELVENVCEKVKQPFSFIIHNINHILQNKNPFIDYS